MLRDIEFFKTKLQHIDGFGDTGNHLVEIIKAKQVKSASPPPPPPPPPVSETQPEEGKDEKERESTEVAKVTSASSPPPTRDTKAEGKMDDGAEGDAGEDKPLKDESGEKTNASAALEAK